MSLISCKFCGVNTPHTTKFHFKRSSSSDEYSIKDYLLMYFKTPFSYSDGEISRSAEAYQYILFPPDSKAEHASLDVGFVNDWIFFSGKDAKKIIEDFKLPISTPFKIDEDSIIEPFIKRIEAELKFKYSSYESKVSALVTEMLVELGRRYEYSSKKTHTAYEAVNNARNYMLSHVSDKISTQDLAKYSNYSISRFCYLYNFFFGSAPMDDLINARIERAITLLKYQNATITETAELCGFSSIHYFSRKFKEKTGVSPSYYLKKFQAPSR